MALFFPIGTALTILTALLYLLFASAILYHLRQYTLPRHPTPQIVVGLFFLVSLMGWASALFFLFRIPR